MLNIIHKPVLLQEIIDIFKPRPGQRYIDATANGGGHTFALWERVMPDGAILAFDKDADLVKSLAERAEREQANIVTHCGSYRMIDEVARVNGFENASGILFDLGYSSHHIEQSGRGFSFQKDEPLSMRYETPANLGDGLTAYEVVNSFPETELADILYQYGDERFSRRIAKAICVARKKKKIETSKALADVIQASFPVSRQKGRINPATRSFQALRIFVNRELDELKEALPKAVATLAPGGILAIISFHSLEDKIVKEFLKTESQHEKLIIHTKKPIQPTVSETHSNPRSRSARLRVAIKL